MSGHTLAEGKYVLGEALGRGGTAHVFRAHGSTDGCELAVKLVALRDTDDPLPLLAHYQRIAQLRHPNILPILDVGLLDGRVFVISPLAAGGSVHQLLQRGQLEPHLALRVIHQVADALQYAHAEGVLHLDVKPGNVLLDSGLSVLLGDFGPHPAAPGPTGRARVRGTPAYMAPEQCTLRPLGPAADQYALGITSFELLAGRRPFIGSRPDDMLRRQVSEAPPRPTLINARLPRELDDVLLKALAKRARHRYPDVATFAAALTHAMAHAPVVAPSIAAGDAEPTTEVVTIELHTSVHRPRL